MLLLLVTGSLFAQQQKVEHNLRNYSPIIFADSANPTFSIYDRMKFHKVPSVSVAVINNGKVEWAAAYGLADVTEKRAATINTLYQCASISKSLNAFFIMKLVQDKKLSLDTDIRQYLKTWTFPDNEFSKGKSITLRSLLSHTAGLSTHGFRGYEKGDSIPDINTILNGVRPANSEAVKPIFAPGARFEYSGGGTVITRKIVDDNIGTNYERLIQQTVLRPLGMQHSMFAQPLPGFIKDYATAYYADEKEVPGKYHLYPELAPDALWSTPGDLAKFIISLQQSLQNKPAVLSHATAKEMCTLALPGANTALGCFLDSTGGEWYFNHSGANEGYRCIYYGSFTTGKGLVVLTNSDNGGELMREIVMSVAAIYNWKGFAPETRKLVVVPDNLLDKYVGQYTSTDPALSITIVKKEGGLQLTARNPEKMYFVANQRFFLMSSTDQYGEFVVDKDGLVQQLVVKVGDKVVLTATKK